MNFCDVTRLKQVAMPAKSRPLGTAAPDSQTITLYLPGQGVWAAPVTSSETPDVTWVPVVLSMLKAGAVAYNMKRNDKYGDVVRELMRRFEQGEEPMAGLANQLDVAVDAVRAQRASACHLRVKYPMFI